VQYNLTYHICTLMWFVQSDFTARFECNLPVYSLPPLLRGSSGVGSQFADGGNRRGGHSPGKRGKVREKK